jgi:AraC-like DNA-binding protein
MLLPSRTSLESQTILRGRNFYHPRYFTEGRRFPLALKSVFNGQALYETAQGRFVVEEGVYLILNAHQPYQIFIDSEMEVETFCVNFPDQLAEEVLRCLVTPTDRLLDNPARDFDTPVTFLEKTYPNDQEVTPHLLALRSALAQGPPEDGWLEERLRSLIVQMLNAHRNVFQEVEKVPAMRQSTRVELYKRLHQGKDYMYACLSEPLTLKQIAQVAAMSPHHFLRTFKQVFGLTPHAYLTQKRLERAQWLLGRTLQPITTICFDVGFESLGSFSSLFQRHVGLSPRTFRQTHTNC